jgi:hypothetical protein
MGRLQVEVQGAHIGREGRERGRRRVCGRGSGRPIGSLGGSREQATEDLCRSDRFKCGVHSTLSKPLRIHASKNWDATLNIAQTAAFPAETLLESPEKCEEDEGRRMALLTGQEQDFASRHAQVHLIEDEPPHAQERSPFG